MPLPAATGRRNFRPNLLLTVLAAVLCVAFIRLGQWQWGRGMARTRQWQAFAAGTDRAVTPDAATLDTLPRFRRIEITGRYDPRHQFLLDNRTHAGRAGYEVLTPLTLEGGRTLLVDRGWVAFTGYRAHLPEVGFPGTPGEATLTGRMDELPAAGLAQGRAPPPAGGSWPKVTSYPDMAQLRAALGRPLAARILLLDPGVPDGFVRDWQPPGLPPARHFSYAIQWWGFAVTLAVIWVVLSLRRPADGGKDGA